MAEWPPMRYLISNVATSLATTDREIMRAYAGLVESVPLREQFMTRIEAELALTQTMLESIYGGPLAEQRPNIRRMLDLRAAGLRVLHHQQIALLERWRNDHRGGQFETAEQLIPRLLLTVNAIASGLGTTG